MPYAHAGGQRVGVVIREVGGADSSQALTEEQSVHIGCPMLAGGGGRHVRAGALAGFGGQG